MSPNIQHPTLRDWLKQAPFGLTLSSGFFGFFAHCGVVSALEDNDLRPAQLSGSSAGALVAGFWAAGLKPSEMRDRLFTLDKADFWDPAPGAGLLRGNKFRQMLDNLLPVTQFEDCLIRLRLSVTELFRRRTHVLEQGNLVPAIYASCCVPIMFQPIRINNRLMVDGGVTDRPGLAGMDQQRVLYHHLSSRSPWRGKRGAHTIIPQRNDMYSLIISELPRVGPNRLTEGQHAYQQSYDATLKALDTPLTHTTLRM